MKLLMYDDVAEHFDNAEKYINENEKDFTVQYFSDALKLLHALPDIAHETAAVLMDIELGKANGIDIAQHISLIYPYIRIIFFTSYSVKYCEEVFLAGKEFTPFALVDKSNLTVNLKRALEKLRYSIHKDETTSSIVIHSKKQNLVIDLKKTSYLESNGHNVIFMVGNDEKRISLKLSDAAKKLPDYFVQCHKSFYVNTLHVISYNSKEIELYNGKKLPVSRNYCQNFRNNMLKLKCE